MSVDDDDFAEDRPETLPEVRSVSSKRETKKRQRLQAVQKREEAEFIQRALADPAGRRVFWSILYAAGTFEDRYGLGPSGFPQPEATWAMRGQKDLGLRLYHTWSVADRAGVLSLLDEFHPVFPKQPKGK